MLIRAKKLLLKIPDKYGYMENMDFLHQLEELENGSIQQQQL